MKTTILISSASIANRSESMNIYWKDINATQKKNLSQEEIDVLAAQYHLTHDENALNAIIKANLKLVISFAKQYQNLGLTLDDLVQEGNLGLIEAAKKYDPTRGFKFSSCLAQYVRKHIHDALSDKGRIVRVPQNRLKEGYNTFHESMDNPLGNDNDGNKTFGDTFASDSKANEYDERNDTYIKIQYFLNKLGNDAKGKKKQQIICLLWGIGTRKHTQYELSRKFGCTEERIRQINEECLDLMRKFI